MFADMAELADALDLGSSVNRRAGSTPVIRIFFKADALLCVSAFFDLENIRLWCTIKKTCPERRQYGRVCIRKQHFKSYGGF